MFVKLGLVLAFLLLAPAARAERRSARLEYRIDATLTQCPNEQAMRDLIAGRLGYDPFVDGEARKLTLGIRRRGAELEGTIVMTDESGQRRRERKYTESLAGCSDLASALALGGSILIDPASITARKSPTPATSPPVDPSDAPPDDALTERPVATPETAPRVRGHVGAVALANVGAEPAPTVGISAFGGVVSERWSVDLEGRIDLPQSVDRQGIRAEASLLVATLAPCVRFAPLFACPLVSVGVLQGAVTQDGLRQSRESGYVAAGARFGGELRLTQSVAVVVHANVFAPLTRTTLDADVGTSKTTLWETPSVAGMLGAGMLYAWP